MHTEENKIIELENEIYDLEEALAERDIEIDTLKDEIKKYKKALKEED